MYFKLKHLKMYSVCDINVSFALRLQERVDINWLPDRLLLCIFSYLPDNDIVTSAQVMCSSALQWLIHMSIHHR